MSKWLWCAVREKATGKMVLSFLKRVKNEEGTCFGEGSRSWTLDTFFENVERLTRQMDHGSMGLQLWEQMWHKDIHLEAVNVPWAHQECRKPEERTCALPCLIFRGQGERQGNMKRTRKVIWEGAASLWGRKKTQVKWGKCFSCEKYFNKISSSQEGRIAPVSLTALSLAPSEMPCT
jgi:hypothetical protein